MNLPEFDDTLSTLKDCVLCKKGFVCNEMGLDLLNLPVERGWWRGSNKTLQIGRCALNSTLAEERCKGGTMGPLRDDGGVTGAIIDVKQLRRYCANNYTGPWCSLCPPNSSSRFDLGDTICVKCSDWKNFTISRKSLFQSAIPILLVVIVVMNIHRFGLHRRLSVVFEKNKVKLKILISFAQVIKLVLLFNLPFPMFFRHYIIGLFDILALDFVAFMLKFPALPNFCMITDYRLHLVASVSVPVFLTILWWVIRTVFASSKQRTRWWTQIFWFLVYPGISNKLVLWFKCPTFDFYGGNNETKVPVLLLDNSIVCNSGEYMHFSYFVYFSMAVICLGTPIVFYCLLWKERKILDFHLRDVKTETQFRKKALPHLEFLFGDYDRRFWWWESVSLLYKLFITAGIASLGSFIPAWDKPVFQACTGIFVAVLFIYFYYQNTVFADSAENALNILSHICYVLVLLAGILLNELGGKDNNVSEMFDMVAAVLLSWICFLVPGAIAYAGFRSMQGTFEGESFPVIFSVS